MAALQADLRKLGKGIERDLHKAAMIAARRGQAAVMQASPRVSGTLAKSWRAKRMPWGALIFSVSRHAPVVEFGRRPGQRPPPVEPILEWVKRKHIGGIEMRRRRSRGRRRRKLTREQATLAFLIARSIGRKGTKGQYVLRSVLPQVASFYWRQTQHLIDRRMKSAAS